MPLRSMIREHDKRTICAVEPGRMVWLRFRLETLETKGQKDTENAFRLETFRGFARSKIDGRARFLIFEAWCGVIDRSSHSGGKSSIQ